MAFSRPNHLTADQIREVLGAYASTHVMEVVRIRYKNKREIKHPEFMTAGELEQWIVASMDSGWSFDMDVFLPATGQRLIGHHDGVYWLEAPPV